MMDDRLQVDLPLPAENVSTVKLAGDATETPVSSIPGP